MYDVIVIGGGAAGLAAATWLGRYRRKVLVVDAAEPRNRWVEKTHGYLGSDPVDPRDLLERAREQLASYPSVEYTNRRVSSARKDEHGFTVRLDGMTTAMQAKRLILATGVVDEFPEVEGFFDYYGKSVFHCPTCDGYEAEGRAVVVFGWGADVTGFSLELFNWAASVAIVTDGRSFEGDDVHRQCLDSYGVDLIEDQAVALVGSRGDLHAVRMRSGSVLTCDLGFFSIKHRPVVDLARELGCELTADGHVATDSRERTSVEGVYAAGDVTPGIQLLSVAAGKGTVAGVECAVSFFGEVTAPGSPAPAPDIEQEIETRK